MKDITYDFIYKQELSHWWYRGRRKLIHFLFAKFSSMNGRDLKILDVGCGAGILMGELEQYGEVHGIDISPLSVGYCKKRGFQNVTVDDLTNLSFPDRSFDVVIALDVLEHIEDDEQAIREIKRVLTDGGIAIIFVPAFMSLWGEADEMGKHFRRYRKAELLGRLSGAGLKVIHSSYFNTFLFVPIFLVRFLARKFQIMQKHEFTEQKATVNTVLTYIFSLEIQLLSFLTFPFGVSCLAVAEKNGV